MDTRNKIGFMTKQTYAGEVFGLQTVNHIKNTMLGRNTSKTILREIDRQIEDESRHITLYKKLIQSKKYEEGYQASPIWMSLLKNISNSNNPLPMQIAAVYGCLEQLSYYIIEDHILPNVNGQDYKVVKSILDDESRHLGMIDIFEDELGKHITEEDKKAADEMLTEFANFIRTSIKMPNDDPMAFSRESKRAIAGDLIGLKKRIRAWG